MPLVEHLRELRKRLTIAVIAIAIGTVAGWLVFDPVFELLKTPYIDGIKPLLEDKGLNVKIVLVGGIGTAFSFRLKLALVVGLVVSSPVWIGQLWGFVLPALHSHEKRRSEEHTSELQSRGHLVCRRLLEKETEV